MGNALHIMHLDLCFVPALQFLDTDCLITSARTVCRRWDDLSEVAARNHTNDAPSDERIRAARSLAFSDFKILPWQRELWECERLRKRRASLQRYALLSTP